MEDFKRFIFQVYMFDVFSSWIKYGKKANKWKTLKDLSFKFTC